MIWKSCHRCGKIHKKWFECTHNKPKHRDYGYDTEDAKLRHGTVWKKKRREIKEKSLGVCAVCMEQNTFTYENLSIHHINKLRDDPSRALDDYNLIALCLTHHKMADKGYYSRGYLEALAYDREARYTDGSPPVMLA